MPRRRIRRRRRPARAVPHLPWDGGPDMMPDIHVPEWQHRTACTPDEIDLFYPDSESSPAAYAQAREICGMCPVRAECLEWAMDLGDDHGMWGGLTARERARLASARGTTMKALRREHRIGIESAEILVEWRAAEAAGKSMEDMARTHRLTAAAYSKRVQRARELAAAESVG